MGPKLHPMYSGKKEQRETSKTEGNGITEAETEAMWP